MPIPHDAKEHCRFFYMSVNCRVENIAVCLIKGKRLFLFTHLSGSPSPPIMKAQGGIVIIILIKVICFILTAPCSRITNQPHESGNNVPLYNTTDEIEAIHEDDPKKWAKILAGKGLVLKAKAFDADQPKTTNR